MKNEFYLKKINENEFFLKKNEIEFKKFKLRFLYSFKNLIFCIFLIFIFKL